MKLHKLSRPISACLLALCCLSPVALIVSAEDKASKAEEIFNGKDLTGWEGDTTLWSVEDGAITGTTQADKPIPNNTFLIWKEGKLGDFELNLEYRIESGNSGIQYRSKVHDEKKFIVGGYQADIDSTMRYTGINYEERGRGILAERGQIVTITSTGEKKVVGSAGDADALAGKIDKNGWNKYKIVAQGNKVQHFINDLLMSEVVDEQKENAATEGVLALQLHAGDPMKVQFRKIELQKK
jgi:Domain of Unknown Function (DUF1080)